MTPRTNVAVFVDWENLYISIQREYGQKSPDASFVAGVLLEEAKKHGIPIAHAYANWENFPGVLNTLKGKDIIPDQAYAKGEGESIPNAADIALCLDAIETCYESEHIEAFVIVSGDADYIEVINRLLRRGKSVYFLGLKRATSRILEDRVGGNLTYLDDKLQLGAPQAARTTGVPDTMPELIRLVHNLENSRMKFVGLKFLRDKHGIPQTLISEAISVGILQTYKVDNPTNPDRPVTACRLVKEHRAVKEILKENLT
jgi:hypothetical protein